MNPRQEDVHEVCGRCAHYATKAQVSCHLTTALGFCGLWKCKLCGLERTSNRLAPSLCDCNFEEQAA